MIKRILTLNNIAKKGLEPLNNEWYEVASEFSDPDAILVRSYNMHDMPLGSSLLAVARAGAGVNNIPVERLSERGIPVFNAPGANANAVKELVIAAMLLSLRNIYKSLQYSAQLTLEGDELNAAVEAGKKKFVGSELTSHTLGVIGLGAIGVEVANAACGLGMTVIGFDPALTVSNAWKLNSKVKQAQSLEQLYATADVLTFHVPLIEQTRHLLSVERLVNLREQTTVMNFSRDGIVDNQAILQGMEQGKISTYVCDFPNECFRENENVLCMPHLGASTHEAETNCATMVSTQLDDFLQNGNIVNSVNMPEAVMPFSSMSQSRIVIVNDNTPGMIERISKVLSNQKANITDLLNKSRNDLAVTLLDIDMMADESLLATLAQSEGVRSARMCLPRL